MYTHLGYDDVEKEVREMEEKAYEKECRRVGILPLERVKKGILLFLLILGQKIYRVMVRYTRYRVLGSEEKP